MGDAHAHIEAFLDEVHHPVDQQRAHGHARMAGKEIKDHRRHEQAAEHRRRGHRELATGLGMGAGQPLTVILTYNYSPPKRHGEGLGLRIAINNSMHVMVPAAFGAIGSLIGLAPVFWVSSAILAAGGWSARGKRAAA